MAVKNNKRNVEVLLVRAELTGVPERGLALSRNLGTVELVWPRTAVARKTASREMRFHKGKADFASEPWTKRVLFREEIDGHCGLVVSVSEPVTVQKLRKFAKLTAKLALKEGADIVSSAMVGYGDIAAAPIDALATMVGESDAPKTIAQGVLDLSDLPAEGEDLEITVPLSRPSSDKACGSVTLVIRA